MVVNSKIYQLFRSLFDPNCSEMVATQNVFYFNVDNVLQMCGCDWTIMSSYVLHQMNALIFIASIF